MKFEKRTNKVNVNLNVNKEIEDARIRLDELARFALQHLFQPSTFVNELMIAREKILNYLHNQKIQVEDILKDYTPSDQIGQVVEIILFQQETKTQEVNDTYRILLEVQTLYEAMMELLEDTIQYEALKYTLEELEDMVEQEKRRLENVSQQRPQGTTVVNVTQIGGSVIFAGSLSGTQKKELRELILKLFREDEVKLLLSEELNRNYAIIASGGDYNTRVANLINTLESDGALPKFLQALKKRKPLTVKLSFLN